MPDPCIASPGALADAIRVRCCAWHGGAARMWGIAATLFVFFCAMHAYSDQIHYWSMYKQAMADIIYLPIKPSVFVLGSVVSAHARAPSSAPWCGIYVFPSFVTQPPCTLHERPAWAQLSREELNVLRHCKSTLNKLLGRMRLCRKVRTSNNHMVTRCYAL